MIIDCDNRLFQQLSSKRQLVHYNSDALQMNIYNINVNIRTRYIIITFHRNSFDDHKIYHLSNMVTVRKQT